MGVGRSLDFFLGRDHLLRDRRLVQICTRINPPARWVFSFLRATLHPPPPQIHDDLRILRPATADPVAMLPAHPQGAGGASRGPVGRSC